MPQYSFVTSTFDGTTIVKIILLPSQCKRAVGFHTQACRTDNFTIHFTIRYVKHNSSLHPLLLRDTDIKITFYDINTQVYNALQSEYTGNVNVNTTEALLPLFA